MNIQDFIIEATKSIASEVLKRNDFTKSFVGRVKMISESGDCIVNVNGDDTKCFIPLNMMQFVTVNDTVVVQDLQNNKIYKMVHGVIKGSGNGNGGGDSQNIIHVYDVRRNIVVSSVMQIWNDATKQVVSTTLKCE